MQGHLLLTNCIEDKVSRPSIEIGSLTAFVVFGLGTEALAVVGLLVLFRRRGWMGRKSCMVAAFMLFELHERGIQAV